ncbi:MAG: MotA/TolQ/ExbB proton channel family protein [Lewinellaceae bacterium]|nr:MotA/TolQ/ExbB proton channel family protein [Lewinellaceae bacterium]
MFANKNFQIAAGTGIAFFIAAIVAMGYHSAPVGSGLETFFFALGGKLPTGIIQGTIFACFFTCLFGVIALHKRIQNEESAFTAKLLPETEQYVLYPEDVNRIKLEVIETERRTGPRMLTDLIKQAATKFRAENSSGETLSIVETVSEMQRKSLEKEFWLISTCQTLIPALGFLGTVLGMAAAILNMGQVQPVAAAVPAGSTAAAAPAVPTVSTTDIQALIDSMGTAFFTTILAIVLGIAVSVMVKRLETRVEDFQTNMKRYVVENLVNRIHR